MQQFQARPPVGVIYDTGFGARISEALALCLLYGLDGKNEARVISISVSTPNLHAAAAVEVFGRFYSGAVSGVFGPIGRNLPIGLADPGPAQADSPIIAALLKKYEHGINEPNDTAEPAALIRNAFTSQYDANSVVILNGPASNLAKALRLPGVKDLIVAKVRCLVIGGDLRADPPAAQKLLAEWPGEIYAVSGEVAANTPFPVASLSTEFAWLTLGQGHPLLDAYQAAGLTDSLSPELAAVLFAIRQKQEYFSLSEPGRLDFTPDGRLGFKPEPSGKHRMIRFDAAQKEKIQQAYVELVSAMPVPRAPRGRPPAEVKPEPPKPVAPPKTP
jgi:hypothetical protein